MADAKDTDPAQGMCEDRLDRVVYSDRRGKFADFAGSANPVVAIA